MMVGYEVPTLQPKTRKLAMSWRGPVTDAHLLRLRQILQKYSGMECPDNRRDDLWAATMKAAEVVGSNDLNLVIARLEDPLENPLRSVWIESYTIHETYFFRDSPQWQSIERTVLPERIAARRSERRLKVWSAGCSTGDEAYTAAILIDQMLPDADLWTIQIIGTDISSDIVQKARRGQYREWSFRQTPLHVREEYFQPVAGNQWQILPKLSRYVRFETLNLKTGSYPSLLSGLFDFDLILCRNVLIYFAREEMGPTLSRMADCLAPGGFLALGPAEPPPPANLGLTLVASANSALYRKSNDQRQRQDSGRDQALTLELPSTGSTNLSVNELLTAASRKIAEDPGLPASASGAKSKPIPAKPVTKPEKRTDIRSAEGRVKPLRELAQAGRWQELFDQAMLLLKVFPLNPEIPYLAGVALKEMGRFEEARESFRKSTFLNQSFWMAHLLLAGLWQREGQFDRARGHLKTILKGLENHEPAEILPFTEDINVGRMIALADSHLKHLEGRN
jgi:chemotaxis protein methyltransferase CheR